jgi:hypothetical protein
MVVLDEIIQIPVLFSRFAGFIFSDPLQFLDQVDLVHLSNRIGDSLPKWVGGCWYARFWSDQDRTHAWSKHRRTDSVRNGRTADPPPLSISIRAIRLSDAGNCAWAVGKRLTGTEAGLTS